MPQWAIFCIKMAIKVTKGQISDGTISQNTYHEEYYYFCGKCYRFMYNNVNFGAMLPDS